MGSNPTPPLTIMLHEILPSKYPHRGSNPAPPLTIILNGILPSKYHKGSNPAHPLTIMFNEILPSTSFCKVSTPPLWTLYWIGYCLQLVSIRNQIRHPLWPPCWIRCYLQLVFIRNQIRHSLWPLCWIHLNRILPSTSLCKVSNSATTLDHHVEWDITFNLSS